MKNNKKLLIVALVLSLLTAIVAYRTLSEREVVKTVAPGDGQTVIVAAVDIPARTPITNEMLKQQKVPAEYIQPGAIRSADTIRGMMTRDAMTAGEQITERRVLMEGKVGGGLAGFIPRDKRAITIAVNDVTAVASFVQQGDYVDIMAGLSGYKQFILQDVQVLAINSDLQPPGQGAKAPKVGLVTLALTPDDAVRLAALDNGQLRLVLRPHRAEPPTVVPAMLHALDVMPGATDRTASAPAAKEEPPAPPGAVEPLPGDAKAPGYNNYGIMVIRGTKVE